MTTAGWRCSAQCAWLTPAARNVVSIRSITHFGWKGLLWGTRGGALSGPGGRPGGSFSAFIHMGTFSICSASPELFFSRTGTALAARPMKGTGPPRSHAREPERVRSGTIGWPRRDRAMEQAWREYRGWYGERRCRARHRGEGDGGLINSVHEWRSAVMS